MDAAACQAVESVSRLVWRNGDLTASARGLMLSAQGDWVLVLADDRPPCDQPLRLDVEGTFGRTPLAADVVFRALLGRTGLTLVKLRLQETPPGWLSLACVIKETRSS
jgi:hypothetical protein